MTLYNVCKVKAVKGRHETSLKRKKRIYFFQICLLAVNVLLHTCPKSLHYTLHAMNEIQLTAEERYMDQTRDMEMLQNPS